MSPLRCSLIVGLAVGLGTAPVWAQPDVAVRVIAPAPWQKLQPPVTQTVNGVTLQITEACWCLREQVEPDYAGRPEGKRRVFAIRYHARDERDFWRINGFESHAPSGYWLNTSGTTGDNAGYVECWNADEVDARWKQVRLDIDFRDPKAPEDADSVHETHEFKNVPIPTPDVVTPLDLELQTAHGTRVRLEKIAVLTHPLKGAFAEKGTYFVLRAIAPADHPEISAQLEKTFDPIKNEKGEVVLPVIYSEGSTDSLFDFFQNGQMVEPPPGYSTLSVKEMPAPGAKTLNLTFKTWEVSPRWKAAYQKQWGRSFHALLDLQSIDLPAPSGTLRPLAVTRGKRVEVALESLRPAPEQNPKHWIARFWTRDSQPNSLGATRRWAPKGSVFGLSPMQETAILRDEKSRVLPSPSSGSSMGSMGGRHLFWHLDNTPLGAGESLFEMDLGSLQYPVQPKQLNIELQLEARREDGAQFDFSDLPIPRPGEVLEVNQAGKDILNALLSKVTPAALSMAVRKIGSYDAKHPLPGMSKATRDALKHSAGLVVVVDTVHPPTSQLLYEGAKASDATGTSLIDYLNSDGSRGGDALDEKDRSGRDSRTYFLLPPTPGATTFSMQCGIGQSAAAGLEETVKLPAVPVPAP